MRVIDLRTTPASPVDTFDAVATAAHHLGSGGGAAHVYVLHFAPGGAIGEHEAGFDQLLVPVQGSGWAAGGDGVRRALAVGEAALIGRGEMHAKGSDTGLIALMVQIESVMSP